MIAKRCLAPRRNAAAAVLLAVSAGAASSAFGQTAYFSFRGNLAADGDKEDFGINLSRSVSNAETLRFQTFSHDGGTNAAGETITTGLGGIDSVLELFDSGNVSRGIQDDQNGASNRDSLLSWTGVQPATGTPLNPSPLPAANYRLNLIEFGNNATGPWSTDLVGPANAMTLSSVTPTGTATISSLKFGTTGVGASAATFNNGSTLNIAGTLGVGHNGNGVLNKTAGTLTVGGITTINTFGTFNMSGGTFNANGNVIVNSGKFLQTAGTFNLGANRTFTASNAAQVTLSGFPTIAGGTNYAIQSGSTLSAAFLDVANGSNGTVTVTNLGSSLNVGTVGSAFNTFWGVNGGAANVTISNQATASINSGSLNIGSSSTAATGTVNVSSNSLLTCNVLTVANASAGTGSLTVDGNNSQINMTGSSQLIVGATSGATGTGTINVQNSGVFTTGTGAIAIQKTGKINVAGGTFNAKGDITLNGGKLLRASGTFNLAAGKNLTASNGAQVSFTGGYYIGDGSTFTIQSGSSLSATDYLMTGFNSTVALVVTGLGSSFSSNTGSSSLIPNLGGGGTATITVSDQATATFNAGVDLGIPGDCTVNIPSGGKLTYGESFTVGDDLRVASDSSGTSVLTINGSGSSLTGLAATTAMIGGSGATTSVGTINLQNSGAYTTGTGTTKIQKTGTINIAGGTFNANGDVNLDGGKLLQTSGTFKLATGKNLTASNGAQVNLAGPYTISNGGLFTVQSQSTLSTTHDLEIGAQGPGNGTFLLTGPGTTLTTNTIGSTGTFIGQIGLTGVATIADQAIANFNGDYLGVASTGTPGTFGTLNVTSAGKLTCKELDVANLIAGTGVVNITGTGSKLTVTGSSPVFVGGLGTSSGTINIQNNGTFLVGTGTTTISAKGKIDNAGGTFTAGAVNNDGVLASGATTTTGQITGAGTTNVTGGTLTATGGIRQGTLSIIGGGKVTVPASVPAGSNAAVSVVNTLTITGTSKFDLTNNAMVVKNSTYTAVDASIIQGYHNGDWLGGGITSSNAALDPNGLTAVGYASNADQGATTFKGVTGLDSDDVLVRYTYYGDSDLNGVTDLDDFNSFLAGFLDPGTFPARWVYGDYDYNHTVDLDDFNVFLAVYLVGPTSLSALEQQIEMSSLTAGDQEMMLTAIASVPEPASVSLLATVSGAMLCRRRRAVLTSAKR